MEKIINNEVEEIQLQEKNGIGFNFSNENDVILVSVHENNTHVWPEGEWYGHIEDCPYLIAERNISYE